MINLKKIKQVAKERKISLKELSAQIGITEQGLQNLMNKNSCNLSTLQNIAEALGVSEAIFFDQPVQHSNISINTGVQSSPNAIQSFGSDYATLLAEKDARIQELQRDKENLMELLNNLSKR